MRGKSLIFLLLRCQDDFFNLLAERIVFLNRFKPMTCNTVPLAFISQIKICFCIQIFDAFINDEIIPDRKILWRICLKVCQQETATS